MHWNRWRCSIGHSTTAKISVMENKNANKKCHPKKHTGSCNGWGLLAPVDARMPAMLMALPACISASRFVSPYPPVGVAMFAEVWIAKVPLSVGMICLCLSPYPIDCTGSTGDARSTDECRHPQSTYGRARRRRRERLSPDRPSPPRTCILPPIRHYAPIHRALCGWWR